MLFRRTYITAHKVLMASGSSSLARRVYREPICRPVTGGRPDHRESPVLTTAYRSPVVFSITQALPDVKIRQNSRYCDGGERCLHANHENFRFRFFDHRCPKNGAWSWNLVFEYLTICDLLNTIFPRLNQSYAVLLAAIHYEPSAIGMELPFLRFQTTSRTLTT
jgi:hypothetical protein